MEEDGAVEDRRLPDRITVNILELSWIVLSIVLFLEPSGAGGDGGMDRGI